MANKKHLKILQSGVNAWNDWRKQHPDIQPNLKGADLRGIDFRGEPPEKKAISQLVGDSIGELVTIGLQPSGIDLSRTNLTEADLSDANLTNANMQKADLRSAVAVRVNLTEACA